MTRQLRVVALLPSKPSFAYEWASAASLAHEVIGVRFASPGVDLHRSPRTSFRVIDITLPDRVRGLPSRVIQYAYARELARRVSDRDGLGGPVDVVHGHFYSQSRVLCELRRRTGIPFVLTEHSSRLTGSSAAHKPLTATGLRVARRGYGAASAVIFVTEYLRECAHGLGLSPRSVVIGNPVSADFRSPDRRPSSGPRAIAWVGRLEADKDPALALRILERLRQRIPDVVLHLIGDGPDRDAVSREIAARGLEGHASLHGSLDRPLIASILRETRAFLSTSKVETFGMAVAEAALVGLPVVAPRLPALVEVLEGDASFFPPGDADAAADRLVSVLEDPPVTATLAASLWARYSPQRVASELIPIYEAAAFGRSAGAPMEIGRAGGSPLGIRGQEPWT